MPTVIVAGQAEDVAKWEAGVRSRGDLLKTCTITTIGIGNDGNEVATCSDVTDLCSSLTSAPGTRTPAVPHPARHPWGDASVPM